MQQLPTLVHSQAWLTANWWAWVHKLDRASQDKIYQIYLVLISLLMIFLWPLLVLLSLSSSLSWSSLLTFWNSKVCICSELNLKM